MTLMRTFFHTDEITPLIIIQTKLRICMQHYTKLYIYLIVLVHLIAHLEEVQVHNECSMIEVLLIFFNPYVITLLLTIELHVV